MPGFNPQMLQNKARNANTTIIMIGDQPIAFCQTVNHSFSLGTEGIYGIGNAKPQEIQQLKASPTITVDSIDLTTLGQTLTQGGSTIPLSSLLANNQFNISIIDAPTGQTTYVYTGSVSESFSQSISSNQPLTDTYTFMSKDVLDNTGQSILNGGNALNIG